MNVAEWILVAFLSVALLCFLIVAIVLAVKLIHLADEAKKIVITGQSIATKTDDIVDNVKGMTSVGGIVKTFAHRVMANQERRYAAHIVKTFAHRVMANQERRYAAQDAARAAADQMAEAAIEQAFAATNPQSTASQSASSAQPAAGSTARSQSAPKSQSSPKSARPTAKKSTSRK